MAEFHWTRMKPEVPIVIAFVTAAGIALALFVIFGMWPRAEESAQRTIPNTVHDQAVENEPATAPTSVLENGTAGGSIGMDEQPGELVTIEDLIQECGTLTEPPSRTCHRMRREFFWSKQLQFPVSPLVPESVALTFADIFNDPAENHRRTVAALSDETCRPGPGMLDLESHDRCHGEAIIRHAFFSFNCNYHPDQFLSDYWPRPDGGATPSMFEDELTYAAHRARMGRSAKGPTEVEVYEDFYRRTFISHECFNAPYTAKERLALWSDKWQSQIEAERTSHDEEHRQAVDEAVRLQTGTLYRLLHMQYARFESHQLRDLAARLGNEFAMINSSGWTDSANLTELGHTYPDIYHLKMIRTTERIDERLAHAINARFHFNRRGWDIDPKSLWSDVCKSQELHTQECKDSIHNIDLSALDDGAIHHVEAFEASFYELQRNR